MELMELRKTVFSTINETDPYRVPKEFQLANWCRAFMLLFNKNKAERLPFFLEILSEEECWEKTDTIHGLSLNRRIVAKKMVQLQNWKGTINPLDDYERYRIACWCCLEEDIFALFERLKQSSEMEIDDSASLKMFVKKLCSGQRSEPLVIYWTHVVGGFYSEMQKEGKHPYESGLELTFVMYKGYVEAVEFFWSKIKSLPETEISSQQKQEIVIGITVHAAGSRFGVFPEIFDYCLSQVSPELYPELLKRDLTVNGSYDSLSVVLYNYWFDRFPKLFDALGPEDIRRQTFYDVLAFSINNVYHEYYKTEGMKCFVHVWMKNRFDRHRVYVIREEMNRSESLLISLTKKNYMELVWLVMDNVPTDEIQHFMSTEAAAMIGAILHERADQYSFNKFMSYQFATRGLEAPSTSRTDFEPSPTKRPKIEQ